MNDNLIKLPIIIPPIVCKNNYAFPLIVSLINPRNYGWFYSNYVQVYSHIKKSVAYTGFFRKYNHDLKSYPCVRYKTYLKKDLFFDENDIETIFKKKLIEQWYIITSFDEYYIPNTAAYNNFHFEHDCMIYGMDTDKKQFYILGYDKNERFATNIIDSASFYKGFMANIKTHKKGYQSIHFIKEDKNYNKEFDFLKFKQYLLDYYYCTDTYRRCNFSFVEDVELKFGLAIYDDLLKYLMNMDVDKILDDDVRPFFLLYEHKKIMCNAIEFMSANNFIKENKELLEGYRKISEYCNIIVMLKLKHRSSKNEQLLSKMKMYILEVKTLEKGLIELFLSELGD